MLSMSIAFAGFLMGLSLIVVIGPQNALIIRQGIKREGLIPILVVCILSDVILIFGGTAGVGALVDRAPIALVVLKWLGVAYLLYFGFTCFKEAFKRHGQALTVEQSEPVAYEPTSSASSGVITKTRTKAQPKSTQRTWVKPVLAALAFTWLNPAAYIDVLVMLGGIANQHGPDGRWVFALGALCASLTWFPFIGYTSTRFSTVLSRPAVWRYINVAIGIIMMIMCARLIMH